MKPRLIFLHGFLGCPEDWTEVKAGLSEEFETAAHGTDRCGIIGYSMGGRLALQLLLRHPERFWGGVIISASPGLRTDEERVLRREHDENLAKQLEDNGLDAFLAEWYEQPLFASFKRAPGFSEALARRKQGPLSNYARQLRELGLGMQPSLWEELQSISVPLQFVCGELDHKFAGLAAQMHAQCPSSELVVLPRCGHVVHIEDPSALVRVMLPFLLECWRTSRDRDQLDNSQRI